MILTVDIGNSRIKWASWQAQKIMARGVLAYKKDKVEAALEELFATLARPSRVMAVCVGGDNAAVALSEWVKRHWQLDVAYLETGKQFENITNAYADVSQHGADRWAAVVAAHQSYPDSPVCVICAGTAITFDLVDQTGRHLGGYILPSYISLHAALLADTAKVESVHSMQFDEQHIPDNTSDAVNQGLHRMLRAGVSELCQFACDKMGASMQVVITGGFAETLLGYPGMPVMQHAPDLVMRGLYNIMQQDNS